RRGGRAHRGLFTRRRLQTAQSRLLAGAATGRPHPGFSGGARSVVRIAVGGPGVLRALAGNSRQPSTTAASVEPAVRRRHGRVSTGNGGVGRRPPVRLPAPAGRVTAQLN